MREEVTAESTYIVPGSIDVATLIVGVVFLTFFIVAASLLARHHLGILTAIVGAGVWILSAVILGNEQELVRNLAPLMGAARTQFDLDIVRGAQRLAPWITGLGVVIAAGAMILHHFESVATPTFEPLEDQHDSSLDSTHTPDMRHTV